MRIYFTMLFLILFTITAYANEKACPTCDFVVIEKANNTEDCINYTKYFFEKKKIGKSYEEFAEYFVPNHSYADFWKRFLPDSNESYEVAKQYTEGNKVTMFYEIIPKKIHIKEGKKANITMTVNNDKYYFQLREVDGGTEISMCFSTAK